MLKYKGLTSDQTIVITGTKAGRCPIRLRRIVYCDPKTGPASIYVFLTSNSQLAAKTIANITR